MVEKHMTPEMDVEGNHRIDWFFNEWVYGTEIPRYRVGLFAIEVMRPPDYYPGGTSDKRQ